MNDEDGAYDTTLAIAQREPSEEQHMRLLAQEALGQAGARRVRLERILYPKNWPFRLKGILGMALLGLIPLLLASALISRHADSIAESSVQSAQKEQTAATASIVGSILKADMQTMESLATSKAARDVVAAASTTHGRVNPLSLPLGPIQEESIYVTSPRGAVIAATRPVLVGHVARGVPAAAQAMASRRPVVVLGNALVSSDPAITIAVPIMQGKNLIGAVVGEFDPSSIYLVLKAGSDSADTLLAADGRIVTGRALPPGSPVLLVGGNTAPAAGARAAFAARQSTQPIRLANGAWAARVVLGTSGNQAGVVLVTPAYPPAEQTFDSFWLKLAIALLGVLIVGAAAQFATLLARPLGNVARALAMVRAGNAGASTGVDQYDEIGRIAADVDMLIARTQRLVADLERQRADLENGIIQLFTELSEAASGDLTVRPTLSEGSLGAVADSVSVLLDRFKGTVKRIKTTAESVSAGTSAMAATVTQVSVEAHRQAEQLAAGAQAIADMAESAEAVSQRTHTATDVATQAVDAVNSGNKAVTFARDAVRRTSETSRKAAREVKSLGESVQLMGNALLLVQHNTEELHMIAGNASIEAARFADNGGIFRTVADSIEQLAQQSQEALRQIQAVIENTQKETSRVVTAIEDVTGEVGNVARAVNLAGENFDTIDRVVQRLADLNVFIAGASKQQATMAANVADMISALNQVSVQTSKHTAASAEDVARLRELTEQLNDSVATLKVS